MGELLERVEGVCPVCREPVWFAAERGFCPDCFIEFPQPRPSRRALCDQFLLRYFLSKRSGFYHREGCKYLRNVSGENLVVTTEPYGKPCVCVKRR